MYRSMPAIAFVSSMLGACAGPAPVAAQAALPYQRVTPEEVNWVANPAVPAGVQSAVLYGHPGRPGLYVMRLKFPPRTRLPVHSHPDERVRTVLAGTYYSAVGERFDAAAMATFPAGTHSHVPVKVWQYAETRDEGAVIQIVGVGPTGIDYLNPDDDPRRRR